MLHICTFWLFNFSLFCVLLFGLLFTSKHLDKAQCWCFEPSCIFSVLFLMKNCCMGGWNFHTLSSPAWSVGGIWGVKCRDFSIIHWFIAPSTHIHTHTRAHKTTTTITTTHIHTHTHTHAHTHKTTTATSTTVPKHCAWQILMWDLS